MAAEQALSLLSGRFGRLRIPLAISALLLGLLALILVGRSGIGLPASAYDPDSTEPESAAVAAAPLRSSTRVIVSWLRAHPAATATSLPPEIGRALDRLLVHRRACELA